MLSRSHISHLGDVLAYPISSDFSRPPVSVDFGAGHVS